MRWKLTNINRISVVVHVSDHLFDGKLQLTECQFPAYSVLTPIRIGGGGRFVNFYRIEYDAGVWEFADTLCYIMSYCIAYIMTLN